MHLQAFMLTTAVIGSQRGIDLWSCRLYASIASGVRPDYATGRIWRS